jgi:hypothetical protein
MKVLFFHGLEGNPNGSKIQFLRANAIDVVAPVLSRDDFDGDLQVAQTAFDESRPDVVVGSSRGGAVAVNIDAGKTPLVLIAPAWQHWGTAQTVKTNTTILHCEHDDLVPFAGSRLLLANSGLSAEHLIVVGEEHRMSDEQALAALLDAVHSAVEGS